MFYVVLAMMLYQSLQLLGVLILELEIERDDGFSRDCFVLVL